MSLISSHANITLDEILTGDATVLDRLCEQSEPAQVFSDVDSLGLGIPILEEFFAAKDVQDFNQKSLNIRNLSIAILTPDDNFELLLAKLTIDATKNAQISGNVRVKNPATKHILVHHEEAHRLAFSIIELKEHRKFQKTENNPNYQWIRMDEKNTNVIYISKYSTEDKLTRWKSILDSYGLAQARVCLHCAKIEISDIRNCLECASTDKINFSNSQILSISKLSSLESKYNIANIYVEQLCELNAKKLPGEGLTALHAAVSLFRQIQNLGIVIFSQLGGCGNSIRKSADLNFNSSEFCAGGQFVSASLLNHHVLESLCEAPK